MLLEQAFPKHVHGCYRGNYKAVDGCLRGDFVQLYEAGCLQCQDVTKTEILRFVLIMGLTDNNPCRECPIWTHRGPKCEAFKKYHTAYAQWFKEHDQEMRDKKTPNNVPQGHELFGVPIRQIAKQLGISLSEARRRKAAGTL